MAVCTLSSPQVFTWKNCGLRRKFMLSKERFLKCMQVVCIGCLTFGVSLHCFSRNLTWRDMQYIVLMSARTEPLRDAQWVINGAGRLGKAQINQFSLAPVNKLVSQTWLLWALRSFRSFTLHFYIRLIDRLISQWVNWSVSGSASWWVSRSASLCVVY